MARVDLEKLERKARAATPGPWEWDSSPCLYGPPRTVDYGVWPEVERMQIIETDSGFYPPTPPDREHIAANSPPVTLALIARIRELEVFARRLIHDHVRHVDETEMHALLDKGVVLE